MQKRKVIYYDFDLDKPAADRWSKIIIDNAAVIPDAMMSIHKLLDSYGIAQNIISMLYSMTNNKDIYYLDEITYLSEQLGLEVHQLLILQLVYEAASACTTNIIKVGNKNIFFRTMDWDLPVLKNITVGLNIIKNGQVISKAITWIGYIGFLTATNLVHDYSISVNYRRTTDVNVFTILSNVKRIVGRIWPIGYFIRYLMETNLNKNIAVDMLKSTEFVSPCYLIIYSPSGSVILTRDADKCISERSDNLYQTNCDYGKKSPDILYSVARTELIESINKKISLENITSAKKILKLLMKNPIINDTTIYVYCIVGDKIRCFV